MVKRSHAETFKAHRSLSAFFSLRNPIVHTVPPQNTTLFLVQSAIISRQHPFPKLSPLILHIFLFNAVPPSPSFSEYNFSLRPKGEPNPSFFMILTYAECPLPEFYVSRLHCFRETPDAYLTSLWSRFLRAFPYSRDYSPSAAHTIFQLLILPKSLPPASPFPRLERPPPVMCPPASMIPYFPVAQLIPERFESKIIRAHFVFPFPSLYLVLNLRHGNLFSLA